MFINYFKESLKELKDEWVNINFESINNFKGGNL